MAEPLPEHIVADHRATLEAFVARARRIEAHSLLADKAQFQRWASTRIIVHRNASPPTAEWDLPPEEAFESLASRCRPLILNDDPIYFSKVFKSIAAFIRDEDGFQAMAKELRLAWSKHMKPDELDGFFVARKQADGSMGDPMSHVDLAESWLYGDLVHADTGRRSAGAELNLNNRFIAAVSLYGGVAIYALATLGLVRRLVDGGLVALDESVLAEPVTVPRPLILPLKEARIVDIDVSGDEVEAVTGWDAVRQVVLGADDSAGD